jgi:hypothetical protein
VIPAWSSSAINLAAWPIGPKVTEAWGQPSSRTRRPRERMLAAGVEPVGGTPEQYAAFIGTEMVKWAKVAKDAGIQPE